MAAATGKLELRVAIGFNGRVPSGLVCHPDKQHIVYPQGSAVVIQHLGTGKQMLLHGHKSSISCVVVSRDGLYLASGEETSVGLKDMYPLACSATQTRNTSCILRGLLLLIQHLQTVKQMLLHGHSSRISCLVVSRDGLYLASGEETSVGLKADIILWSFEGKELLARLTLHKGRIEALAFSANSLYLLSLGGQDDRSGTIRVWELDIAGGKIQPTDCQTGHLRRVATCLKMADDDYLYVGTSSGDVVRVNTNNKLMSDCRPQKQKFSLGVTALLLLKTGDLIVGTGEGSVALCKGSNYKVMKKIQVQGAVTSLTCSNQGHQFFVGTNECQIYRVNSPEFKEELIAACHSEAVNDVAFAVGSSDLFATCSVNDIRVWHTPVSTELRRFTHRNVTCLAIEVTKDATSIISVWNDGAIRALTPETGDLMYVIEHAHSSGVTALAATNDCKRIISGGREGEVRVWKIGEKACKLVEVLKGHKRDVTCIKIKKNDQECVTASLDGMCITWDLVRLTRKQMFLAHTSFKCVCYHPEEYQIITGGTDRKVGYWEVFDGSSVREVEGSAAGSINGMDITSDGACFVTGGDDGLVRLWDYNKGAVTYIGVGHSGSITRVKICPGKKYIVSASADGAILIWNLPPSH